MSLYGTIEPQYSLAYPGKMVSFKCNSFGTLKWYKNYKLVPTNMMVLNTLVLANVTEWDTGTYKCYGYYPNGTKFKAYADLRVGGISIYLIH